MRYQQRIQLMPMKPNTTMCGKGTHFLHQLRCRSTLWTIRTNRIWTNPAEHKNERRNGVSVKMPTKFDWSGRKAAYLSRVTECSWCPSFSQATWTVLFQSHFETMNQVLVLGLVDLQAAFYQIERRQQCMSWTWKNDANGKFSSPLEY